MLAAGCLVAAANAQPFSDGVITASGDFQGSTCTINAPIFSPVQVFIVLHRGGRTAPGIIGARFAVTGIPAGWFVASQSPPPGSLAIGDALAGGVAITLPECSTTPVSTLLLMILLFSTTTVQDHYVYVRAAVTPTPGLVAVLCDTPTFTEVPVGCGAAVLNATACPCCTKELAIATGPCDPVGVSPTAWSGVKALFR
jgi:hypothetical protein